MGRACCINGGVQKCIVGFGVQIRRKDIIRRPRHRRVDNSEINFNRNRMGVYGLDSSAPRWRQYVGSCEYGNEALGFIKFREFLNLNAQ